MLAEKNDVKKVFMKKGACSHTFFYLLNREFGFHYEIEEPASDPFAGGILQQGYQCGMLWGASLAVGAESYRRHGNCSKSVCLAINATQKLMESFKNRTNSIDCYEITDTDFNNKFQYAKYLVFKAHSCFSLAKEWGPDAARTAIDSLSGELAELSGQPVSCASETALRMGASEAQAAMVAGFAGGLGLSGNACGALAAAIWMKSIAWCRVHPGKSPYSTPIVKELMEKFSKETDYKLECREITGKCFNSLAEHTEYIRGGGCKEIMNFLAEQKE